MNSQVSYLAKSRLAIEVRLLFISVIRKNKLILIIN